MIQWAILGEAKVEVIIWLKSVGSHLRKPGGESVVARLTSCGGAEVPVGVHLSIVGVQTNRHRADLGQLCRAAKDTWPEVEG